MHIGLSPENELFVQSQLDHGTFEDRNAVINAGLALLRNRQALIDHLTESDEQLKRGEYTDYDDESLKERFEELKERARTKARKVRRRA